MEVCKAFGMSSAAPRGQPAYISDGRAGGKKGRITAAVSDLWGRAETSQTEHSLNSEPAKTQVLSAAQMGSPSLTTGDQSPCKSVFV